MKKLCILILISIISIIPQTKRAITVEDLWNMKRIGTFDVSPDGKKIVFELTTYGMESNKGNKDIYIMDADGKNMKALKNSDKNESEPQFLPDGQKISYIAGLQLYTCNLDGTKDEQMTSIYTGASGYEWSKDGRKLLFVSSVFPDCMDQDCNKEKDDAIEKSKVKAKIITSLMFRYWNDWRGEKRSHLFLYDTEKKVYSDITMKSDHDVPPLDLGSSNDYSFSPDGSEIVFTMNEDDTVATSTNNDIFIVNTKDINSTSPPQLKKISISEGNDFQPVYSPDGKYIAWLSMTRAGYEADKKNIIIYDRFSGALSLMTETFKLSAAQLIWSADSKNIYFTAENEVWSSVYNLEAASGNISMLLKEHVNSDIALSSDGKKIFFKQMRTNLPHEIFAMQNNGSGVKQLSSVNGALLSELEMNAIETFWAEGAGGTKVQSIIVKPPFFDPSKKYPMIFLIHGGPQGHWNDDFHYRWNQQMFAAQGYVVVSPNPRGSTGYGQQFTDEIQGDWGGKPYVDLMNSYDYAVKNYSFIDKNNTFAAGASYGGYMINWLEGHEDRFNAVVSHDGVFNLESKWGTTEELWFPEWEFKGTPWQNRAMYQKWSPHMYIQNAKTPMLIVHGALDFRVTEDQAFQLFTSLQRLGVESKLLYFPDEFHFVTKPQNSRLWWTTVYDWFEKHKKSERI